MNNTLLKQLHLKNLLSFGPDNDPIPLGPLNVLIGPNGSGKSNLIEAIGLLRAAPKDLSASVREAGGVSELLWQGEKNPTATIEAIIENPQHPDMPIRHSFSFVERVKRFEMTAEVIENSGPYPGDDFTGYYYKMENGNPLLYNEEKENNNARPLQQGTINTNESILSQIKDSELYPTMGHLVDFYSRIRLYREWSFGRNASVRQPQKADLPGEYLSETCDNLPLVLNYIRHGSGSKHEILDALKSLYQEIDDFHVQIIGGWVQLVMEEGKFNIPSTRLSDGTLRYLCLLAILCHPEPPPLVCIEEPDLGLHPDLLPDLARLMISASERSQLIVTTHSDILVDALTETPESVIVCNKHDGKTQMKRLKSAELSEWLKKYRLGQLWLSGEIGGTRW